MQNIQKKKAGKRRQLKIDRSRKKIYERLQQCGEEARDSKGQVKGAATRAGEKGSKRNYGVLRDVRGRRERVLEIESKKSIQERKRRCEDHVELGGSVSRTR